MKAKALIFLLCVLGISHLCYARNMSPQMRQDAETLAWFSTCNTVTSIYPETQSLHQIFSDISSQKTNLIDSRYSPEQREQVFQYKQLLMDELHARKDIIGGCRFVHKTVQSTVNAYKWFADSSEEAVDFLSWCTTCFNVSKAIPDLNTRSGPLEEAYTQRATLTASNNLEADAAKVFEQVNSFSQTLLNQNGMVHYCDIFYLVVTSTKEIYGLQKR